MNIIVLLALAISALATVSANYHRPTITNLLYRPPPRPRPNPFKVYRVRRQLAGSVVSNPQGPPTLNLQASQGIGTPNHNLIGTAFASGVPGGDITRGGQLDYNLHGHGASISQIHKPGVGDISKLGGRVNLLDSGNHRLDANAFKSSLDHVNGLNYQSRGGSLDYNHAAGHGLSLGASRTNVPAFPNVNLGTNFDLTGKANLWRDRSTSLDLTGTASRTQGGINHGANNFGAGLGLTHFFRG